GNKVLWFRSHCHLQGSNGMSCPMASISMPPSSQQGSVMFNCFVLSATYQPAECGKLIAAFIRFVLVQLRNSLCHNFNVLFHNKSKQFAASLPDVQQVARRCSNR